MHCVDPLLYYDCYNNKNNDDNYKIIIIALKNNTLLVRPNKNMSGSGGMPQNNR